MMFRTDDPIADAYQHDWEEQRWLEKLPKCVYCDEPIQDDIYFEINGEPVCEECLNEHHRKAVEDYVE